MKLIRCLRRQIMRSVAILSVSLLIASSSWATTMFKDGTFNEADWTLTIQTVVNGGTVTASQSGIGPFVS